MRNAARSTSTLIAGFSTLLFFGASPLHADLTLIDMFRNIVYDQTSGAAPTSPAASFLNLEAYMANPTDFTSVTVSYPGPGSPASLPLEKPTEFGNGVSFTSPAAMNAAYPMGTYTFTASNGTTSEAASLDYTADAFTSNIPALTAATYNALQGMNSSNPFAFNLTSFTPNPLTTYGVTFLTVFNTPFQFSGPPGSTTATMLANTLMPGTTYEYELDFSDRVNGIDPLNGVPTTIGFDVRTDGFFTTATPEPGGFVALGIMLAGMAVLSRRNFRSRT
jgi:hypothetical protein